MPQVMSSIGGIFSGGGSDDSGGGGLGKILGIGSVGAGLIGNILGQRRYNSMQDTYLNNIKAVQNLTPAQMATAIAQLQRPLSTSLTQGVGNVVQADMAQRGLSQAPGIFSSAMAQALAPYQQKEQEMAMQAYLQKLGLPIQGGSAMGYGLTSHGPQLSNLTGALQMLRSAYQPGTPMQIAPPILPPDPSSIGGPISDWSTFPTFPTPAMPTLGGQS